MTPKREVATRNARCMSRGGDPGRPWKVIMFPYFGKKFRNAKLYPTPKYQTIVEPFAGSMGYSLHYRPDRAIGIEADDRVVELWNRSLTLEAVPRVPEIGSKTDDLLVKLCSYSEHSLTTYGPMTVTSRMVRDWGPIHQRILDSNRWCKASIDYAHGSYLESPDIEATWFIDPPYQCANKRGYRFGPNLLDYEELSEFARSRQGQVIVCEQKGADWLPFKHLYELSSHRGSRRTEMIWTNDL